MALSDEARAFLAEPRFAVLATINPDGTAQQTVMWYQLRDDHIMMNTKRGRLKDRNVLHDPRISICVADGYKFVTVAGDVHLIEDQAQAQADIRALAIRYHGVERGERQAREQFTKEERVTLLLPIEHAYEYGLRGDGE